MIIEKVDYSTLKSNAASKGLKYQYIDFTDFYHVYAIDGLLALHCKLDKDGGADQIDFDNNYKSNANKKESQLQAVFADKTAHEFDGQGFSGNAIKNTSTNIDYTITGTRDFSGIEMINGAIGDNIMMRILDDASGTYSGYPNATLNQYGTNWFVRENFVKNLPYPARVYTGMIVRFVYTNANVSTDRTIYFNLDLHKVV